MTSTPAQLSDDSTVENDISQSRNRHLARSTITVMVAFGIAKVISLGQVVIIANVFGVGAEWDAFVTANRLPELIFTLIAGGALAHAFIPVFSGFLARNDSEGAWRMASHVINFIFLITCLVSLIVFLFAPWFVANVVAPGFDAEARAQTAGLMRILLIGTMVFSVSGIVMGILQSFNHFLLPALAPIMFDIGILFGVIFLLDPLGVRGIALGAVLGAVMHLGIQVPGLLRFKAKWFPEIKLKDPVLWRVIRLMLPRVAGLGVFSLNFLIMTNIASRLGTGSVSALDWGWRLMQIPQTLIGTAMGVVIFPTLAALSEIGDESGKRGAMTGALRFILVASIPSSVALIVLGRPVISLLERGAFDASASALVYSTLQFFALGLIVHSALEVIARSFYADKDTLTPLWAALGGAAINLVLSLALSNYQEVETLIVSNSTLHEFPQLGFSPNTGNVGGLALANSLGVMFEVFVLLFILRRRWHGANENVLAETVLKTTAASLGMAGVMILVGMILDTLGFGTSGLFLTVTRILVEGVFGVGSFLILMIAFRMKEWTLIWEILLEKRVRKAAA